MGDRTIPSDLAIRRPGAVSQVASVPEACARDPARDLARDRKLPLRLVLRAMSTWAWDTIGIELENVDDWTGGAPTASASSRQRARPRDDVMPRPRREFLSMWHQVPSAGRFVPCGVDGTDPRLPNSPDPRTRVRSNQSRASHNEAHPTTACDIGRRTYQDMVWQGPEEQDEPGLFCRLVDRTPPAYAPDGRRLVPLWLGDRNLRGHDTLCHPVEAGHAFVPGARDDWAGDPPGSGNVPEGCLGMTVERIFVRTSSLGARSRPDEPGACKRIKSTTRLDAIGSSDGCAEYPMTPGAVRRRIPGDGRRKDRRTDLVTNLGAPEFTAKWLVRTYRKRWSLIPMSEQHAICRL